MQLNQRKTKLMTVRAIQASGLIHIALGCALAASQTPYVKQLFVPTDNVSRQIELTTAFSETTTQRLETNFASPPVLISPGRAQFADQTFIETLSVDVALESIISAQVIQDAIARATVYVTRVDSTSIDDNNQASPTDVASLDSPTDTLIGSDIQPVERTEETDAPTIDAVEPVTTPRKQPSPVQPKVAGVRASAPRQELVAPNFSSNRPPRYPDRAKLNRWEGVVLLKVEVDEHGLVTEVKVIRSSGHSILDAAAVNSVRSWHGTPAKWNGKPISSSWDLPVKFKL
ncbi:MAG: TonB family protein [Pirellulaceae bacterium]